MNCLSCGRWIPSQVEAVCTEKCRDQLIELYQGAISNVPTCEKNRSRKDPRKLREDLIAQFSAEIQKLKAAPVVEAAL